MSNEWLTTGQMLDKLETGQVAECMESPLYEWIGTKVEHRGLELRWTAKSGKHEEFYVSTNVQKNKWSILPNYLSFEEATKALKEGYIVKLHHEEYKGEFIFNINTKTGFNVSLTFEEFYNGKWTIE